MWNNASDVFSKTALNYISSNHYDLQKRNLRFMLLLLDEFEIYFFGVGKEEMGPLVLMKIN